MVEALAPLDDDDAQHGLVSELRNLSDALKEPSLPLSLYIYERSPCMYCRGGEVRRLGATRGAPAWVLEECEHDASDWVRDAVAGPAKA